jgi:hypothetical protein
LKIFLPSSVPLKRMRPAPSSTQRNVGRMVASTRTVTVLRAAAARRLAAASRRRLAAAARRRRAVAAASS